MSYPKTNWTDGENKYSLTDKLGNVIPGFENIKLLYTGTGGTPLSATNMNKIEQGIYDLDGIKISSTQKGVANGVCELDSGILIPVARLPVIPTAKLTNAFDAIDDMSEQWALISSYTLANSITSQVSFSGISTEYRALKVVLFANTPDSTANGNAYDLRFTINGRTSGYSSHSNVDDVTTVSTNQPETFIEFLKFLPTTSNPRAFIEVLISCAADAVVSFVGKSLYRSDYNKGAFREGVGSANAVGPVTSLNVMAASYFKTGSIIKLYGSKTYI